MNKDFLSQIRGKKLKKPSGEALSWAVIKDYVEKRTTLYDPAPCDFCALECLANDPFYAKPDTDKVFILWEAKLSENCGIVIEGGLRARRKHEWVHDLFIDDEKHVVRFPFNAWDSDLKGKSLSWETVNPRFVTVTPNRYLLPRWSTASRSCLALIPQFIQQLPRIVVSNKSLSDQLKERIEPVRVGIPEEALRQWNKSEWEDCVSEPRTARFRDLGCSPGQAAQGVQLTSELLTRNKLFRVLKDLIAPAGNPTPKQKNDQYRLYSLKTGVRYIGSTDESGNGKDCLEANCSLAMLRSEIIRDMANSDTTFGIQTEVLTITAPVIQYFDIEGRPMTREGRDGFQVRDLSCMRHDLAFIPGQAIPYARAAFDKCARTSIKEQCEFWRNNFAIPLGRAKARLFLNYGLIHTSANAQNFLAGFNKDLRLEQFIARDIGDTSWHDEYIKKYHARGNVYHAFARESGGQFKSEEGKAIRHVLHDTSSGDYPPPHMIRLAAYSLLTHGFKTVLARQPDGVTPAWTAAEMYRFATGILDGFKNFMTQALGLDALFKAGDGAALVPDDAQNRDLKITAIGDEGKYPTKKEKTEDYWHLVDSLLKNRAPDLFAAADRVRERGNQIVDFEAFSPGGSGIEILINAEEILLCAGFEVLMGLGPQDPPVRKFVDALVPLFKGAHKWPQIIAR